MSSVPPRPPSTFWICLWLYFMVLTGFSVANKLGRIADALEKQCVVRTE